MIGQAKAKVAAAWCAVALAALSPLTRAAGTDAQDGRPQLDSITVEAQKQREAADRQASAFVSAIAVQPYEQSLARWNTPICPLVAGLPRGQGEFILARLSQIVAIAGAPLAPENCRANFYVVATRDPDALLKKWRNRDRNMFGNAPEPKIGRFLGASRPVRVWYNAPLREATGMPLTVDGLNILGNGPVIGTFYSGVPANIHAKLSPLQWDELQSLASVIVIIDTRHAQGINFGQLADYVAMVGLAEVRLDADLGAVDSILRVFAAAHGAAPPGLTPWDQAFLKALYHTDQSDRMQVSMIKGEVSRAIAP
ncbi:MAG: hypothetical protein ACLP6Z_09720 [Steroidobacteraceae bacterium]